jgi:hypothetical protein
MPLDRSVSVRKFFWCPEWASSRKNTQIRQLSDLSAIKNHSIAQKFRTERASVTAVCNAKYLHHFGGNVLSSRWRARTVRHHGPLLSSFEFTRIYQPAMV